MANQKELTYSEYMQGKLVKEAAAKAKGFTKALTADNANYSLDLLVKPETDLDEAFKAYDRDNQEWLTVNGWNFDFIEEA